MCCRAPRVTALEICVEYGALARASGPISVGPNMLLAPPCQADQNAL